MTRPLIRKRPFHFKNTYPSDPNLISFAEWRPENRAFYREFREWLKSGGYSEHVIATYSVPVRLALSLLDKSYPEIDPSTDLEPVQAYLRSRLPAFNLTYSPSAGILDPGRHETVQALRAAVLALAE